MKNSRPDYFFVGGGVFCVWGGMFMLVCLLGQEARARLLSPKQQHPPPKRTTAQQQNTTTPTWEVEEHEAQRVGVQRVHLRAQQERAAAQRADERVEQVEHLLRRPPVLGHAQLYAHELDLLVVVLLCFVVVFCLWVLFGGVRGGREKCARTRAVGRGGGVLLPTPPLPARRRR